MGVYSDDAMWDALLQHRARAVRVARARCATAQDAEDCVQEAMLRVAGMPDVDLERVGPLLSTVVANLATDGHRSRARAARAHARMHGWRRTEPPVDEQVCDELEARWLWSRRGGLGAQDRQVLELRAQGLTVGETASALGLTYKATEASLTRARSRLKRIWRAAGGLLGILWWRPERQLKTATVAVVAAAGAVLTVNALPPDASGRVPAPPPATRAPVQPASVAEPVEPAAARPAPAAVARTPAAPVGVRKAPPARPKPVPPTPPSLRELSTDPIDAGGVVQVGEVRTWREHEDETFVESLERCLEKGAIVTPHHIECRE